MLSLQEILCLFAQSDYDAPYYFYLNVYLETETFYIARSCIFRVLGVKFSFLVLLSIYRCLPSVSITIYILSSLFVCIIYLCFGTILFSNVTMENAAYIDFKAEPMVVLFLFFVFLLLNLLRRRHKRDLCFKGISPTSHMALKAFLIHYLIWFSLLLPLKRW